MRVVLAIDWSRSLKDKRRVVRSLKDTLHRRHQVSVAEVDDQDILNRAQLGITLAGGDGAYIGSVLDRVLEGIRSTPDCEVTDARREILHGWVGSLGESHAGARRIDDEALERDMIARGLDEIGRGDEPTHSERTA